MFDYFEGSWDGILVIVIRSLSELLWSCVSVPGRNNRLGMTLITCLPPVLRLRMTGAMHVSPPTICCYGMHFTYYVAGCRNSICSFLVLYKNILPSDTIWSLFNTNDRYRSYVLHLAKCVIEFEGSAH